jgi:hypothetical protein
MFSMPELIVVVSTDTVDPVRFRSFFLASAVWVATVVAAAREADTFPVSCYVRRSAVTLDDALRDVVGASSSLPIVATERYSSTGGVGVACTSTASQT